MNQSQQKLIIFSLYFNNVFGIFSERNNFKLKTISSLIFVNHLLFFYTHIAFNWLNAVGLETFDVIEKKPYISFIKSLIVTIF